MAYSRIGSKYLMPQKGGALVLILKYYSKTNGVRIMKCIVNMDTKQVLTYKEGDTIRYASNDVANQDARNAQLHTNIAHAVLDVSNPVIETLGRIKAPWFK